MVTLRLIYILMQQMLLIAVELKGYICELYWESKVCLKILGDVFRVKIR